VERKVQKKERNQTCEKEIERKKKILGFSLWKRSSLIGNAMIHGGVNKKAEKGKRQSYSKGEGKSLKQVLARTERLTREKAWGARSYITPEEKGGGTP